MSTIFHDIKNYNSNHNHKRNLELVFISLFIGSP